MQARIEIAIFLLVVFSLPLAVILFFLKKKRLEFRWYHLLISILISLFLILATIYLIFAGLYAGFEKSGKFW
ncbi:hypothetical protein A3J17_03650 [Candidatus Curtissbacteria bacterium RIFCSPLOWO2_02_FULL_40_11]|uniref:Uncharacterized protein n=2 Tax=Candidatus Curtissiibacteriota TaxID=1752717 RepID=A0A1F5GBY9_9BACT|nr:MAG: hypothetical protein A3D04_03845 [Candidatus Curtissbacteria bacterium RIFCSPHIGHO2_02_FULL_40_16b]OGD90957.1 MAG: hypothetical protein A3E11_00390 [Candidatus Curtissbacteria bacterium RIFCSPHIGHO2_12_FULL_38_37]OGE01055.1 MAG: hypothetical protein A3J17_03650 [Candidatus Curtissbacteria bacterium RIFCSPLOWO2_02_FULL_40_11]OGE12839.1 MAG: hypothetical protein A3G14_00850 [Candidatus Curtissbacteria bacterium RIFCSPLOWO2_12_FULL_38_9]